MATELENLSQKSGVEIADTDKDQWDRVFVKIISQELMRVKHRR